MADEISIPCLKVPGGDGTLTLYDSQNSFPVVDSIYIKSYSALLINNIRVDDDPTTYTSVGLDVRGWQACWVEIQIDSTLSPTTLRILAQFSLDGGNFYADFEEGLWASLFWEDTATASGIRKIFLLPCGGVDFIRFQAIGAGTDATNYFDVTLIARQFRGSYATAHA